MGYYACAGGTQREVLQLLRGALSGHRVQSDAEAEDALLHGQSDHTMRRHIIPVRAGILSAQRLGREDLALYQHPALVDCVLFTAGRDYSADVADGAAVGQISALHYDAGHALGCGNHCGAERQL